MLGLGIDIPYPLKVSDIHKCKVLKNMGDARVLVVDEVSSCQPRLLLGCHEVQEIGVFCVIGLLDLLLKGVYFDKVDS